MDCVATENSLSCTRCASRGNKGLGRNCTEHKRAVSCHPLVDPCYERHIRLDSWRDCRRVRRRWLNLRRLTSCTSTCSNSRWYAIESVLKIRNIYIRHCLPRLKQYLYDIISINLPICVRIKWFVFLLTIYYL